MSDIDLFGLKVSCDLAAPTSIGAIQFVRWRCVDSSLYVALRIGPFSIYGEATAPFRYSDYSSFRISDRQSIVDRQSTSSQQSNLATGNPNFLVEYKGLLLAANAVSKNETSSGFSLAGSMSDRFDGLPVRLSASGTM